MEPARLPCEHAEQPSRQHGCPHLVVIQERLDLAAEGAHLVLVQHHLAGHAMQLRRFGVWIRRWRLRAPCLAQNCMSSRACVLVFAYVLASSQSARMEHMRSHTHFHACTHSMQRRSGQPRRFAAAVMQRSSGACMHSKAEVESMQQTTQCNMCFKHAAHNATQLAAQRSASLQALGCVSHPRTRTSANATTLVLAASAAPASKYIGIRGACDPLKAPAPGLHDL